MTSSTHHRSFAHARPQHKLKATQALSRLESLVMEVSAKGDGWEGVSRMREVGGLVGRRAVTLVGCWVTQART
jgi:hypothetical protein